MHPFGNGRYGKNNINKSESKENMNVAASGLDAEGAYQRPLSRGNVFSHHRSHTLASAIKSSDPQLRQMTSATTTPPGSPADSFSRIPRPKSTAPTTTASPNSPGQYSRSQKQPSALRRPMSLKTAFKLAQEQQSDDGTIDLNKAFNMASAEINMAIDASPSPAPRIYRSGRDVQETDPRKKPWSRRGSELGQQLQQFDRNHQLGRPSGPLTGLFTKNRVGPKVSETGHALARKSSNSSLGTNGSNRGTDQWNDTPTTSREKQRDQGGPIPSIEFESAISDGRPSPISYPANTSPEKSFNWHLDADFTAGDLQFSDSPRIRSGKANGESRAFPVGSPQDKDTPRLSRSNNKLDRIREREAAAESIPLPEDTPSPPTRRNTKLDEIRAREIEALSRRAVATSRLDEIKVRNSEARSESPEMDRRSRKDSLGRDSLNPGRDPANKLEEKSASGRDHEKPTDPLNTAKEDGSTKAKDNISTKENNVTHDTSSQDDSHELLRRLARATSSSPSPPIPLEKKGEHLLTEETLDNPKLEDRERSRPRWTREEKKSKILEFKSSRERPSVGFVGLQRVSSSDSLQSKRASRPTSEIDPTDRIEAEMKLFAPLDNYSEKGSVRAPSPYPPDLAEEETPRPNKIDPLMLSTPRVSGAYVETPATVRVKEDDDLSDKVVSDSVLHTSHALRRVRNNTSEASAAQTIKREDSDGGVSTTASRTRSSSAPVVRRARSVCRRRRRPLINTAKPPSVRDDLRAILRRHEIDDSTLEDFDERLAKHEVDPEELEQLAEESTLKVEDDPNLPELTDNERELQPYARMGKSLKTLLTDIRSAKQGIERLEDKVSHTDNKPQVPTKMNTSSANPISADSAAIVVSFPRLWRREPKFRLTPLGILSLLLAIWWPIELVFSHYYATPQYQCTDYVPCDWSPNEPYYPYTMPFMLDEWATGGKGRAWALRVGEELGDLAAEISDWITNTDFTQHDEKYMDVWERKRHRRRLQKHGLTLKWVEPADYKPRYAEWEAARRAREEALELGYDIDEESMRADESFRW